MANPEISKLTESLHLGDIRALARSISIVENDSAGAAGILQHLSFPKATPVIGITGPPGAGKSSLVNELVRVLLMTRDGLRIGVLAVDPTSPFTKGSLLGDRLRMGDHFNDPSVFIRSIASRGVMGGLSAKTLEITDLMRASGFDYILVETIGVGQSELDIASLADHTIVVLVPESGDEIQTIKSGIMEIADVFVVNKSDRPGSDAMVKNLEGTLHGHKVPVIKTVATTGEGIPKLVEHILAFPKKLIKPDLLYTRALRLMQQMITTKIEKSDFRKSLEKEAPGKDFNLYRFVSQYYDQITG